MSWRWKAVEGWQGFGQRPGGFQQRSLAECKKTKPKKEHYYLLAPLSVILFQAFVGSFSVWVFLHCFRRLGNSVHPSLFLFCICCSKCSLCIVSSVTEMLAWFGTDHTYIQYCGSKNTSYRSTFINITYIHTGNYTSNCVKIKKHKLSFASLILCEISAIIHFWSVRERISASFVTLQEGTFHNTILFLKMCPDSAPPFTFQHLQGKKNFAKILLGGARIAFPVLGQSAALFQILPVAARMMRIMMIATMTPITIIILMFFHQYFLATRVDVLWNESAWKTEMAQVI